MAKSLATKAGQESLGEASMAPFFLPKPVSLGLFDVLSPNKKRRAGRESLYFYRKTGNLFAPGGSFSLPTKPPLKQMRKSALVFIVQNFQHI